MPSRQARLAQPLACRVSTSRSCIGAQPMATLSRFRSILGRRPKLIGNKLQGGSWHQHAASHQRPINAQFLNNSSAGRGARQTGSLKYTHHFGLWRFFTLGEQLILQDSVTHSINDLPPPLTSILGAAAFAAGDKLGGRTCFGSQDPPFPVIVARHCSMVTKPQLVPPLLLSTAHHLYGSAEVAPIVKNIAAAATTTTATLKSVSRMSVTHQRMRS